MPKPVKPVVRQAAGKNNIRPTTAKNSHAHAPASASSAANTAAKASLVAAVAVLNANDAPAELAENAVIIETPGRSDTECKQKVGALLREWDWN
ncbi:hypothetical protein Ndes2526B_g05244 [Nannochloris sp. 'desiccata']|nr:hypothetical protein KSW81_000160 [Chlorella desiccata (nom. nud.)]KAH7617773.1 hypothetical protein NADE_004174 [Chlorella desiccata (nom. nud.)]KAH7619996.1 hypothetical protein NADE_008272 [Chlorella desiccata (nom. nud.)]